MPFVIADTFQESLADLANHEQKQVKQTVFDFQIDRSHPSMQLHRIDNSPDDNFWSARVNQDIRIVVHKQGDHFALCYVDHHDDAYEWAERRKLEKHPETGAVQLVEVEERTEEIVHEIHRQREPKLFDEYEESYLLKLGVPPEWLEAVRHVGESQLLELVERLPEEVGERLVDLATGEPVPVPEDKTKAIEEDPFEHPDTRRRFHVVEDERQLRQALEWPWERWVVFLHPKQRDAIEKTYNGPAYVSGGAGTGKTVVAMHWASRMLDDSPDEQVLFTTFSKTLAARLESGMDILLGAEEPERDRLNIVHLHKLARDIWCDASGRSLDIVDDDQLRQWLTDAATREGLFEYSEDFLFNEWDAIIDAWGIRDWETYRDFSRRGRGNPLGAKKRFALWSVFEEVFERLEETNQSTWSSLCYDCIDIVENSPALTYKHVVVDESQDFGPAELQLLETMAVGEQNNLFLVGDSGQRLYKRYFNWSDVGIRVVGRSTRLKVNYRTTEQIRDFADELLPPGLAEHGDTGADRDAVSLLSGIEPSVHEFDDAESETAFVAETIEELLDDGFEPEEIAVFARTHNLLEDRAIPALELLDLNFTKLRHNTSERPDSLALGTMHSAKGLEFRAIIVIGCSGDVVPARWVVEDAADEAEREELVERERNLLYVACTRAREQLVVTYTDRPSPFLE